VTVRFSELRAICALVLVGALLAAVSRCGGGNGDTRPEKRGDIVARVGATVLTTDDLENLLPESEDLPLTEEERRRVIERWVHTEMLHQEAVRRGLASDPRIQSRLKAIEREYLADHLVYLELRERTRVTEQEIEDYFIEHRDEYLYEYRVSHILVNTLEDAENVKERLKKKSFSWIANRHSVDPVAKRGGDLGYLTKGNMIPEFENVIFDMKPGEVSDIVKSDFGYHIIKLIGTRESFVKVGLDDVSQNIMNMLLVEKRERAYRELLDALAASQDVEYFDGSYAPASPADSLANASSGDTLFGEGE
jgi:peptidyl-prolyl cis-trans isomerase C